MSQERQLIRQLAHRIDRFTVQRYNSKMAKPRKSQTPVRAIVRATALPGSRENRRRLEPARMLKIIDYPGTSDQLRRRAVYGRATPPEFPRLPRAPLACRRCRRLLAAGDCAPACELLARRPRSCAREIRRAPAWRDARCLLFYRGPLAPGAA